MKQREQLILPFCVIPDKHPHDHPRPLASLPLCWLLPGLAAPPEQFHHFNHSPSMHLCLWFLSPMESHIPFPFQETLESLFLSFLYYFIFYLLTFKPGTIYMDLKDRIASSKALRWDHDILTFFSFVRTDWHLHLIFQCRHRWLCLFACISSIITRNTGCSICVYSDSHLELEVFRDLKMALRERKHKQTHKYEIFILCLKNKAISFKYSFIQLQCCTWSFSLCWVERSD